jgi:hypothetical protein
MTRQVSLSVNDKPIELDYFVLGYIDHVLRGILEALEGIGDVESVALTIKGDIVQISVNNAPVSIKPFVNKIVGNTVKGMVSPLKGVSEINSLDISIRR